MHVRFSQTALLASFTACAEPEPAVWEGDLVTVTSSDGVALCGGTLGFLDRFLGHAYQYWTGEEPPEDFALELDLRVGDPSEQGGLATSADGYAWTAANRGVIHELTHLTVGWNDGSSAPSLAEGIAEGFGPGDPAAIWSVVLEHPLGYAFRPREEFFYPDGGEEISARYYGPSAQLVRYLIDRYGVPTVRAAYREARADGSAEEIEAAFVDVFGDGIYDAFDDFEVAPQCALQAWECSDAVVPLRELPVIVEQLQDCRDDPVVVGATAPDSDLWFPVQQFAVDVPKDVEVVIDTTDNAVMQRMSCLDSCDADVVLNALEWFGGSIDERTWSRGRVTISIWPDDPAEPFSASIEIR